jgi:hypothetical protein
MSEWTAITNNRGRSYYINQVYMKTLEARKVVIQTHQPLTQNRSLAQIYLSYQGSIIRYLNVFKQLQTDLNHAIIEHNKSTHASFRLATGAQFARSKL